ncbi:hypothetical protein DSM104443_00202 [Usitatibacter rugosus]|uniref:Tail specific protease domain-containing protein n=1 Tax=Usitatibacter rugosus TaxID=2732067 RepID=A0A6M4GQ22_9PROT|nr:S41 family peptidase [Usitatibacter rugosus]QJR09166.1 hypothetical protein DSM104443_00202 [Usitatibacter rugosus]
MSSRTSLLVLLIALGLSSCASIAPPAQEAALPFKATEHAGVWLSDGYGYALDSRRGVRLFHVAGETCVEDKTEGDDSIVAFYDRYRAADGGRTLLLSSTLDPYEVRFRRAERLPEPCDAPMPSTPAANLQAFSDYYARHYAYFDLYGVNWAERSAAMRKGVTGATTDRELFERMREAVAPLRDSHVKIEAKIDGKAAVHEGDRGRTKINPRAYWLDDIQRDLLGGKGRMVANRRIQYGFVAPGVGYLAFASMGGFVDGELASIRKELPTLEAAMDEAIAHLDAGGARAMIVDVSFNTGGYDFIGLAIAGRFAERRTFAYGRRAGDDPTARDFPIDVVPSGGPRFTGPVYLLTSDGTVSACEVLTLAMRALPNVTHAGERTRGAFSTVLTKYLPNGWELSLSNEIYTDPRGIVWEGRGIEPAVPLAVFYPDNPLQGHVEAVHALARSLEPR